VHFLPRPFASDEMLALADRMLMTYECKTA
jgi:hypothetical protein